MNQKKEFRELKLGDIIYILDPEILPIRISLTVWKIARLTWEDNNDFIEFTVDHIPDSPSHVHYSQQKVRVFYDVPWCERDNADDIVFSNKESVLDYLEEELESQKALTLNWENLVKEFKGKL